MCRVLAPGCGCGQADRPACSVFLRHLLKLALSCCAEFIQLVTAEANQMVDSEKKQTMSPEHVLRAIQQLEFDNWQADLTSTISEFKTEAKGEPLCSNLGKGVP